MSTPDISPLQAAVVVFRDREAALVERCALHLHDAVAPVGLSFADARALAGHFVEATDAKLHGRYAPHPMARLNGETAQMLERGGTLEAVARGMLVAVGALLAVTVEADARAVVEVAKAAGDVAGEVAAMAARTLEERGMADLRGRNERGERIRYAVERLTSAALAGGDVERVATDTMMGSLDCDWAVLALVEADGSLPVRCVAGRDPGFGQRFSFRRSDPFTERVLASDSALHLDDMSTVPVTGDERPRVVFAGRLIATDGLPLGIVAAGRNSSTPSDDDHAILAGMLAGATSNVLETAGRLRAATRASLQVNLVGEAATSALAGRRSEALSAVVRAAATATDASVAILRLRDEEATGYVVRAVFAESSALMAEIDSTRVALNDEQTVDMLGGAVLRGGAIGGGSVAELIRRRLGGTTAAGVAVGDRGTLVVARASRPFTTADTNRLQTLAALADLVAERETVTDTADLIDDALAQLEVLGAANNEARFDQAIARLACRAAGAERALLYRGADAESLAAVQGSGFRREDLAQAPGQALAADAVRRGEAIVTGGERVGVTALAGARGLAVVLSMPLVSDDHMVGALQLFFGTRAAADAASRSADGRLARLAATAVACADDLRSRDIDRHRLTDVLDIARAASVGVGLDEILRLVKDHLASLLPRATAGVFLVEHGRVTRSDPASAAHRPFVTLLLRGEAAMSPVLIDDVMAGSQFEAVRGSEPGSVRSLLVVPLRFRATTIGAVGFASSSSGAFTEADLAMMQRQAAPLALAIGSAVLASSSEELEQQHELIVRSENLGRTALRVHDELAGVITGSLTVEQTQAQLARLLADLLGVDATIVLEASDQVDDLRFSVSSAHVRNESLAAAVVPAASRGEITLPSRVVEVLRRGKVTPIPTAELRTAPLTVVSLLATGASAGLVPVVFKGRLYAVYLVISLNPSDVIDEQRLERAVAFASHSRVAFI